MTDRHTVDSLTSDALDALYDDLDQARTHADPELHARLTAAINALGKSETELATLRAANTRVRALAGRIRQGVPWTANADDIAAHILRALDRPDGEQPARTTAKNPDEPAELTGYITPDPPIRCLNLGQPKEG